MNLLTKEEESVVKELARSHYEGGIKDKAFDNSNRMFGVEVEFSIVDEKGNLCVGLAEKISQELPGLTVVPELGSYQIEVNPSPTELKEDSFSQLHSNLINIVGQMRSVGERFNSLLLPIGIPSSLNEAFFNKEGIYTDRERYHISAEFSKKYGEGSSIRFENGTRLFLPNGSGVTIINEHHTNLQATSTEDAISLFNYSQMLTPLFVSLGANSGMTNGKKLLNLEHQIRIFEECEGFFDGKKEIPRVGLFPCYIQTLDDYFNVALSFRPLYAPRDNSSAEAFELMLGTYYGWTRIRTGTEPTPNLRIEFRPISTQPTIIENVAFAEYFIKSLLFATSQRISMLPEEVLQLNFDSSVKDGMEARLYWNFSGEISEHPVSEILQYFYSNIGEGELLKVMEPRINKMKSPANRLIEDTFSFGRSHAENIYLESFERDSAYII